MSEIGDQHKGHPVFVVSGFTADQRVRYARDPNLIMSYGPFAADRVGRLIYGEKDGKKITAQYVSDRALWIKVVRV